MKAPRSTKEKVARMWQEAELYEAQGLYSHALELCHRIVSIDPRHKQARERLSRLPFPPPAKQDRAGDRSDQKDDSTTQRLSLDLGVAYMGMGLYPEALDELRKGLKNAPAYRTQFLQHIATCLIRLKEPQESREVLKELLREDSLKPSAKGVLISEMVGAFVEEGFRDEARLLLLDVPEEVRPSMKEYEDLAKELLSEKAGDEDVEVLVEDPDTGEVYTLRMDTAKDATQPESVTEEAISTPITPAYASPASRSIEIEPVTRLEKPNALEHRDTEEFIQRELSDSMRFACTCGMVHFATKQSTGTKRKCDNCGKELIVPAVDDKRDSLTDNVIGKVVGGCRILYRIGGGGMGGVYKGHHIGLDLPVAVKILHSHLAERDPVFIKRFLREARAAAKLEHPNVVGVLNVGFEDGLHFLVMSYIGGGSAASRLAARGRLPVNEVIDIAIQMARALVAAEEHNILHRDIKPANILFTEKGEAKLTDLGLAKNFQDPLDEGLTQTGIACGTPLYFSPEQAKGSPHLDIRSDIYSLGITLYHLLEGWPPFTAESAYVIFQKHVHEELPPFKKAKRSVPDSVFKFLRKMTAKKPEDRFKSAQDLLDALLVLKDDLEQAGKVASHKKGLLERLGITKNI
ncbi:MAG: protein kinase [Desulfomonile sp.]|nr:protein kinase [Desulfomonile sp.]